MLRLNPPNHQNIKQSNSFMANYGGAESNVMCGLNNLGHKTEFVTKLPNNELGYRCESKLRGFDVDTSKIIFGDGRLGIYFLEEGHGPRASKVIYDRRYSAISLIKEEEIDYDKILSGVKLLHITGIIASLSLELRKIIINLAIKAREKEILVSYDSNFRERLWTVDECGIFTKEILKYVDIAFLGILDLKNILKLEIDEKVIGYDNELELLYKKLFFNYENIKIVSSTKRIINSTNNNTLTGFIYDGKKLYKSREYTFDILDRVGGGDAFTTGILHGVISSYDIEKTVEFAVATSVLKHSYSGDVGYSKKEDIIAFIKSGVSAISR